MLQVNVSVRSRRVPISVRPRQISIATASRQGPPGQDGADGNLITRTAAISLSGHRMVTVNEDGELIYADNQTSSHAAAVLGMTTGSASPTTSVIVRTGGEIAEPSWSWTVGAPIYLSANGVITQTAPTTGFILIIGFALGATSMLLDFKSPIHTL